MQKPEIFGIMEHSEPFHNYIQTHIQNPAIQENLQIFRTLTYLKPDTYAEPSQRFKMEFFSKIVKNYNYFSKVLHLRSLIELWKGNLWISTHYLLERPCTMYCMIHIQNRLLLKIQTYSGIFTSCSDMFSHTVAYLEPCVILAYSEPFHIHNSGIFRTQDIFRTLPRLILAYWVGCVMLAFWKTCFIQNFDIFRILALRNLRHIQNPVYLGTFRHIQT